MNLFSVATVWGKRPSILQNELILNLQEQGDCQ
jgi:hypothetical protein